MARGVEIFTGATVSKPTSMALQHRPGDFEEGSLDGRLTTSYTISGLPGVYDPRVPVIILKSRRRKDTFDGKHEWRRYEGQARRVLGGNGSPTNGKYPLNLTRLLQEAEDTQPHGINGINKVLPSYGFVNGEITDAVLAYGKETVREAIGLYERYDSMHATHLEDYGSKVYLISIMEALRVLPRFETMNALVKGINVRQIVKTHYMYNASLESTLRGLDELRIERLSYLVGKYILGRDVKEPRLYTSFGEPFKTTLKEVA